MGTRMTTTRSDLIGFFIDLVNDNIEANEHDFAKEMAKASNIDYHPARFRSFAYRRELVTKYIDSKPATYWQDWCVTHCDENYNGDK